MTTQTLSPNNASSTRIFILGTDALFDHIRTKNVSESDFGYTNDVGEAFADSAATVVIPFESPLVRLRDAIAAGTSSQDALTGWTEEAKAVLEAVRQNRRRATLVDASLLAAGNQELVEAMSERLGLEMTGEGDNGRLSAEELIPLGAILKSDAAAMQLAQELEAMHVGPVQIRLHELLTDVEASETLLRSVTRVKQQDVERPLLIENITLLNEALQSAESLAADGEKRIQTFKNEVERQRAQAKLLEVEVKSLKQRLEEAKADKKQREAVLAVSLAEVDRARIDAENRLRDVHASTSWFVTKPLRFFRRLFG